ncbi:polysaccharide export protein [Dysgonomonas sp. 216]|uniref:polysaccharide biosynthesis/export family protein n=1 Tax=Dysgonomonas sp. 216 TaxID=2302934 RepID=UPI0013D3F317|nr:polysaccharide biosynthesis/export family protein [Dysgonomonas sp. 216]NDW17374.1 polysaccharide export protein [Dysgonomonas sp. 216]
MKKILLFSLILAWIGFACSTPKGISYFEDIDKNNQGFFDKPENFSPVKIKVDDELSIVVSARDPQAVAGFNLPMVSSTSSSMPDVKIGRTVGQSQTLQTYIVDADGSINMPGLGRVYVEGKTTEEITAYVTLKLEEYVKDPIVTVRLMNFSVSVLGQVNSPGKYEFKSQYVTVLDAITAARDLTTHGVRENVLVIRRDNKGDTQYYRVDLTSSEMFSSSHFYLQQGDVVYVTPNKEKQRDSGSGTQKSFNLTVITTAVSYIFSIIVIVLNTN